MPISKADGLLLLSFHFLEDYISQTLDLNMGIRQEASLIEFSSVYFMTDLEQNYSAYMSLLQSLKTYYLDMEQ